MTSYFSAIILFFITLISVQAQIVKANLGIDGFTCSLCALSVEKSIQQLPFVEKINMNINDNTAEVVFRKNGNVSIRTLAKKVRDAGFSVRYIKASFEFKNFEIENNTLLTLDGVDYMFLQVQKQILNGERTILFLNKELISKREYTKWERWIKASPKKKSNNVYYVSLYLD